MFVSAISGSKNAFAYAPTSVQNKLQQFQQEFGKLGQDLQSGNLSAAQTDFSTLQQVVPQPNSTAPAQAASPLDREFQQLSQDLQSGNLSAAQRDFANIQQGFQNSPAQLHRHQHPGGEAKGTAGIDQLLNQLGQDLQPGNLSASQQAYPTLLQDLQQFAPTDAVLQSSSLSGAGSLSVSA
jgi:hypothetical protein